MFHYDQPLSKKDILVVLIYKTLPSIYSNIIEKMQKASNLYDFTLRVNSSITHDDNFKLKHAILIAETDHMSDLEATILDNLSIFNSLSIANIYSEAVNMTENINFIEYAKKKYQDKVNFLRPNLIKHNKYYVSDLKLIDNAICDTKRIKYNPHKIDIDYNKELTSNAAYFKNISNAFGKYKLYHRAPSDGFISIKTPKGILISATKTNKVELDMSRVSLIVDYEPETNKLTYAGKYLPSSDGIEAYVLYKNNPNVKAIIHTHASNAFTRNNKLKHKIAVGQLSYGTYEVGQKISPQVTNYLNDFFIIDDHGEMFTFTENYNNKEINDNFIKLLDKYIDKKDRGKCYEKI